MGESQFVEIGTERQGLGRVIVGLLDEHWPNSGVNGWYLADLLRERGVRVTPPPLQVVKRGVCTCGEVDKENRLGHADGCRYFADSVYAPITSPGQTP